MYANLVSVLGNSYSVYFTANNGNDNINAHLNNFNDNHASGHKNCGKKRNYISFYIL